MTDQELQETLQKYADDDGFVRTRDLMTGLDITRQTALDKYIHPGFRKGYLSAPERREIDKVSGGTMMVKLYKVKGAKK